MITISMASEEAVKKILGVMDFSYNLLNTTIDKGGLSSEFNDFVDSATKTKPYIGSENVIFFRSEHAIFLLDNASWLLDSKLKKNEVKEDEKVIFENSSKLMKELIEIIKEKKNYTKDYTKDISCNFKISFNYDNPDYKGLITPKKGQVWKLKAINKESGDLEIVEKLTNVTFFIAPNDFHAIAYKI